jgi:hypothetical protein
VCSGTQAVCPMDTPLGAGWVCRASSGGCDPAEACDGTSMRCPTDALAVASSECRSASALR